ncbi:hypothetical protein NC652_030818 [Populus alba x Populus x berolinensis]|nr:hypothetical protein NC652_030806 [Populus alba x Populus x berolinensis]KAJ6883693.1 hypothetical protein NC652_030818 [Populus alba x Populus x berolinensis]
MDVKLLESKNMFCKFVKLARDGRSPESWFPCTDRDCSSERVDISGGRVPERLSFEREMEVTLDLEESHFIPCQEQKVVEDFVDQPEGNGVMELASLRMVAPSSAVAVEKRRRKREKRKGWW